MATIVEMINPLTGLPEQVDKLDHTAQEIDDAVGRSLPGAAIDAAIQAKPNPNLLDNWYFVNPVNQRGKTEQYGGGYFIDRWIVPEGKMALSDAGVTLAVDGVNTWFNQRLDVDIAGKIVTLSALTADGKMYTKTGLLTESAGVTVYLDGGGYASCHYAREISMYQVSFARNSASTSITFIAAKLELGSQQTLAHQDADGNWVLNEIPDYGEQLRRCQYYSRFFGEDIEIPCSNNGAGSYIEGTLPLTMRSGGGAISYGNSYLFLGNGTYYPVTNASVTSNGGRVKIGVNVNGQMTSNQQATLHLTNCSIVFDL